MSMVRGKLEAIRDVSPQELVVGDVLFVQNGDKWFDAETKVEAEVLSLEDLANERRGFSRDSANADHSPIRK